MRILTVVGARPQFIKSGPVSRQLVDRAGVEELLVHTGQHYDDSLSGVFFRDLELREPDYRLGVGSASHGVQVAKMLIGLEALTVETAPDLVLVYGDTNSTLAGALAAAQAGLPLAHVEAGLRSYDRRMPEEINRVLTDHVSDYLLAPTTNAVRNLEREGFPPERTYRVGDVMFDVALRFGRRSEKRSRILEALKLTPKEYLLATVHRAENTDDPARLRAIFDGLADFGGRLPIVVPLHPRTEAALKRVGLYERAARRLRLTAPVSYLDMIRLEKNSRGIATDSGGVQKEAFFYRVPCITLRAETEWVELVESGWNRLAPPTSAGAVCRALEALSEERDLKISDDGFYGDGNAARKICDILCGDGRRSDPS